MKICENKNCDGKTELDTDGHCTTCGKYIKFYENSDTSLRDSFVPKPKPLEGAKELLGIQLSPVCISITVADLERMRENAKEGIDAMVMYNPDEPDKMLKDAMTIKNNKLYTIMNILDKYEYMEYEGFEGPD